MIKNRIVQQQADYVLVIVRKPLNWRPARIDDVPHGGEILSKHFVASYPEARDDLMRCNQLSLQLKLDQWAVIHAPCGGL